jgi:hypothetical protein
MEGNSVGPDLGVVGSTALARHGEGMDKYEVNGLGGGRGLFPKALVSHGSEKEIQAGQDHREGSAMRWMKRMCTDQERKEECQPTSKMPIRI